MNFKNNDTIHILHVIHGMDCGGAENAIMNLYRHVDRSKIQFDFMVHTNDKCFFDDEINSLGGNIYHVPYYYILNIKEYKDAVKSIYKNHPEIKIVHGHLGSCAHIYLSVANKCNLYTIAHSHSAGSNSFSLKKLLYKIFTLKTHKTAKFFFSCGHLAGLNTFGKKITTNPKKYCLLENSIDSGKYKYNNGIRKEIEKELGYNSDIILIGHVGRLVPVKNHKFIIEIFEELYKRNDNYRLIIIGDGLLYKNLNAIVNKKHLTNCVKFVGIRNDVSRLLQRFDCFVMPSLYEGFPVTLLEAQASGLPCVISENISKEVGITDLVHYVALSESVVKWADKIESSFIYNKNRAYYKIDEKYNSKKKAEWLTHFYLNKITK